MRARPGLLAFAAVGAATLLAGAAPAAATASAGFAPQHATHPGHAHPRVGGTFNQDGGNWSGWVSTGSGFSSVSASWTEPEVTCNSSNDLYAPWVGIDGYGSQSVEQTGVATDCSSGSPNYQAWYEMYPDSPVYYNDPVSAGDNFTGTVQRSGTNYTLTITDNTQGWTEHVTKSYNGANSSAEFILESPTGAYPNFGTVHFSGATVDGSTYNGEGGVALDASNNSGFEDHTSEVSNGSFDVNYVQE
ncbi:G1 family glutamic endopeptidase [Kutzneria buriramensis]|uniref:Peptidase A4-like protein n=1 Tax=Kutzneria buriramensis TaxID=1045776 RepID=A0A3E0GWZ4_9PSEU|nr:G1 family glutamic endopeptidase [Kutzneria buriramensis]REH32665.1 peptidase A4-like protein [Kutzneria buriramensis]